MNLLDTRRFFVTVESDDPVAVTPVNSGLKYRWQVEEGTRFYRKKLTTKLVFKGADYTFFKDIYDGGNCDSVTILIEVLCGVWREEFTGKIVIGQGDYHLDRCRVEYDVLPYDAYDCFKRALKTQFNWLPLTGAVTLRTIYGAIVQSSGSGCIYSGASFGDPANFVMFLKDCWSGGTNDTTSSENPDPSEAWRPIEHTQEYNSDTGNLEIATTWAREFVVNVGSPPGAGWINTSGNNWVRPVMYSDVSRRWSTSGDITTYDFSATPIEGDVSNARLVKDLLPEAFAEMGCATVIEVQSDFLDINPPATAPSNTAYTYATDYMADLLLFQKSDVVNANASNDATRLFMSMDDFLKALGMLNLYWSLEPSGGGDYVLRIEHYSFYDAANGLDLTALADGVYTVGNNQFAANTAIPGAEVFEWQEAFLDEFSQSRITYPAACSDSEDDIEYRSKDLSCDFGGLLNNTAAGLTGFVLVSSVDLGGGEYLMDNSDNIPNGIMSWYYLHSNLWVDGRYHTEANSTAFGGLTVETVRRNKEQAKITYKYCCEEDEFNPVQLLQSGLGWGQIKDAEHDTEKNNMTVTLLH